MNTTGQQQPDQQVQINKDPSLEAYTKLRDKKVCLPKLNPFITVFPNLSFSMIVFSVRTRKKESIQLTICIKIEK
jgi:hypothetical protein